MRSGVSVLIGLGCGILGGVLVTQTVYSQRLGVAEDSVQQFRDEKLGLHAKLEDLGELHETLLVAHDGAKLELTRLQAELTKLKHAVADAPSESDEEPNVPLEPEVEGPVSAAERGPRRGPRDWNDPAAFERMQQRFAESVNERWENTDDPGRKDRIALFAEHQQYLMDLRMSMASTEDEAERESIRADMRAAGDEFRQVVRGEQDKLIADLGDRFGIEGEDVDEFHSTMRYMLSDPAFTSAGFGGRRGGPR